jgi:hypothetical protein
VVGAGLSWGASHRQGRASHHGPQEGRLWGMEGLRQLPHTGGWRDMAESGTESCPTLSRRGDSHHWEAKHQLSPPTPTAAQAGESVAREACLYSP